MTITNYCSKTITIYIRFPKPMKASSGKHLTDIILSPNQKTTLPYHLLVGAKGWKKLLETECVHIARSDFEPRFAQIQNISSESLTFTVTPDVEIAKRHTTSIRIAPKKPARSIDSKSIDKPSQVKELELQHKVRMTPVRYIGPPTEHKGAVGSFLGESVYVCYKCGGPIIFRGSPARPVHI
jgi:hypothetical protein